MNAAIPPSRSKLLEEWIGREEQAEDVLTSGLVQRFAATLGLDIADASGSPAPRMIHYCLCPPVAAAPALGADGHPQTGDFIPPVGLPRRMWAGSDIGFQGELRIGETVRRTSTVTTITEKRGRTGQLCFVTIRHHFESTGGGTVIEMQSLVYREAKSAPAPADLSIAPAGQASIPFEASPTLLFRYSALTFNGHRIHYDQPYATQVEGYPGLVVHAPLQATLLCCLASAQRGGRPPSRLHTRSHSTLFQDDSILLHAGEFHDGGLPLWSARDGGAVAMAARAEWD